MVALGASSAADKGEFVTLIDWYPLLGYHTLAQNLWVD